MTFSPQDTAKEMIIGLRTAHAETESLIAFGTSESVVSIKNKVEAISTYIKKAQTALALLQTAFTNTQIATRVADHLEPSPASLTTSYSAAIAAWQTMADDYGANVMPDMGAPWVWDAVNRKHDTAFYNISTPTNFRANLVALRDALADFG